MEAIASVDQGISSDMLSCPETPRHVKIDRYKCPVQSGKFTRELASIEALQIIEITIQSKKYVGDGNFLLEKDKNKSFIVISWTEPWVAWFSVRCPCPWQEGWNWMILRLALDGCHHGTQESRNLLQFILLSTPLYETKQAQAEVLAKGLMTVS
ncbi:hypothetical protein AAES_152459 [Amazona aestiva]|uniref:Uncharacterized protein n=1 Tax=Amazona aestiva TaxID=12930 RepID=A0A0Q3LWP4_AMAAE|nr:hypothetical protein AAES_152459 [Amazona aestiva]